MAKIEQYPEAQRVEDNDVFLLDGTGGTKVITAKNLAQNLPKRSTAQDRVDSINFDDIEEVDKLEPTDLLILGTSDDNKKIALEDAVYDLLDAVIPADLRRNIWRGKNLGNAVTADQYNQIDQRYFKGMFLGDYWEIDGRIWRIVDFNYWWNSGDTLHNKGHVVIMPDHYLYTNDMSGAGVTNGAYVTSWVNSRRFEKAKSIVTRAFGESHIYLHRNYLQSAVTSGHSSGGTWIDSSVDLPNEIMIYGSYVHTAAGDGSFVPNRYTVEKTQLAGMASHQNLINPWRESYWLRDVVSGTQFAEVSFQGFTGHLNASEEVGVRPVFGLVK